MDNADISMIRRRGVYHIAGYYPFGSGLWHRYFKRELGLFARLWNVRAETSDLLTTGQAQNPAWTVTTSGSNWQVLTQYEPLLWDDIVLADAARPAARRYWHSFLALLSFLKSGTVFRYFRTSWQYALFVLYPFILLAVFAAIAWLVARYAAGAIAVPGIWTFVLELGVGIGIFLGLLKWPGRHLRLQHALDDWIFSREFLERRRPDIEARLDRFAERLTAQAQDDSFDEILLVGHSMGATLAIEIIARALARDPGFGRHGPSVGMVSVGSTVAKFTLHPSGEFIRRDAEHIIAEPSITWAEYHARADAISFYKFNAVTLTRFFGDRADSKPIMRRVKIHEMLSRVTYFKNRFNFMRLHCQFIMANERRSTYDYFMMICGPLPFSRYATAARGAAELITSEGTLVEPAAADPVVPVAANDSGVRPGEARTGSRAL